MSGVNHRECPSCHRIDCIFTDERAGRTECHNCGTVLDNSILSEEAEWRNFEGEEDKAHAEKEDSIFPNEGAGDGQSLAREASHKKNVNTARDKINSLCKKLHFSERIASKANAIFVEFEKNRPKNVRGANKPSLLLAIIRVSCNAWGEAVEDDVFLKSTGITHAEFNRSKKKLKAILKDLPHTASAVPKKIQTIVAKLVKTDLIRPELDIILTEKARHAFAVCRDKLLGKQPATVACVSIIFAARHEKLSLVASDVAAAAGITEATLDSAIAAVGPLAGTLFDGI